MNAKKKSATKSTDAASRPPAPPPKKAAIKQVLQKPQPWSFGGRGGRGGADGGAKARPDAERIAGKSRKVH